MAEQNHIELDLDKEVAQGQYSNLAVITHSVSEFILDFAEMLPGLPKPKVVSRIILTPEHAKRLLLSGEYSITRVADMLGYSSIHNFSRAFKATVGISPTEYKRKITY